MLYAFTNLDKASKLHDSSEHIHLEKSNKFCFDTLSREIAVQYTVKRLHIKCVS